MGIGAFVTRVFGARLDLVAAMDPKQFHLDWDQTAEALAAVVVLAFVVERGLALLFDNRALIDRLSKTGYKEVIAFGVSLAVCWHRDFDALAVILSGDKNTLIGYLLTAGVVAGGSNGAIKLFKDVMGLKNSAVKDREARESGKAAEEPLKLRRTIWEHVQAGIGAKKKVGDDVRPLIDDVVDKAVVNIAKLDAKPDAKKERVEKVALPAIDRWAAAMAPAGNKTTVEKAEFLAGTPLRKGWPFEPETK